MPDISILLIRDHESGKPELLADYFVFVDPYFWQPHEKIVRIAARIAASGNKQGITRVVACEPGRKVAREVTMDDITHVGFVTRKNVLKRHDDYF